MVAPKITNPRVLVEPSTAGNAKSTKVICVSWELLDDGKKPDGEWIVEWDDMYGEAPEDIRSARSEQGNYFVLQREIDSATATNSAGPEMIPLVSEPPRQTESPTNENFDEPLPTGPLSTAKLLEFENGPNFREVQEDLSAFFAARPIVQAPAQINPDFTAASKKTEVLFLLSADQAIPSSIKVYFTPTWTSPNTPPTVLAEISQNSYGSGQGLYVAWAEKRLSDLKILEDIAKELELEGSRGTGQGRVKVGVEGGGMDEEAVRREGWMVGEEQVWVHEKFLEVQPEESTMDVMDPLAGLGISSGLNLMTSSTVMGGRHHGTPDEEDGEDLFALPLSPRSPDMSVSPFSMFRGEATGKSPQPSKLRQVESINTTALGMSGFSEVTPTSSNATPTGVAITTPTTAIRNATPGAPPTPPREARVG
ncbi:hypothetical protein EDC01DRAFT_633288 [Geopyxis carbonaria]|nr:hypothetical protein EDC01DRAFT_633288 [Geopyxis carbonaria]